MLYSGQVLHALSGAPLVGISVSDGRNVTRTDAEGRFSLPGWERAHVINVGLLTKVDHDWFRTTEEFLSDPVFRVTPVEDSTDFCFLHTSDTEIGDREDTEWVDRLRDLVEEHHPAFFIHTGDLAQEKGMKKHHLQMNATTLGCPVRYSIGNHDFWGEEYGEQWFERDYAPSWYSFDYGNVHFVALQMQRGDHPSGYKHSDQWIWLREDLRLNRGDKELIVFCHTRCESDETGFTIPVEDDILSLREENLRAWVFGHYHIHCSQDFDGVLSLSTGRPDSGNVDSSPSGTRKYSIVGGQHTTEILYSFEPSKADPALWQTQLPGRIVFSTPLVSDGDILVATSNADFPRRCGIFRISGKDGSILWSFDTDDGIPNDMVLDQDRLYAQDNRGNLFCLSAQTGELLWRVHSPLIRLPYTQSGVLLLEDRVIVGKPRQLYAYCKETGALLWHIDLPRSEDTPARWVWDPTRNQILISGHWYAMVAIDPNDGSIRWQQSDRPVWFRTATPLVDGDLIYTVGTRNLTKMNAEDGSILLTHNLGFCAEASGAPVRDGNLLYYSTAMRGVVAVDSETLEPVRFFPTGTNTLATVPYVYGDMQSVEGSVQILGRHLLFTSLDGYLYDYDKETGELLSKTAIGAPSLVSPLILSDGILVADFCGVVHKFPLPKD